MTQPTRSITLTASLIQEVTGLPLGEQSFDVAGTNFEAGIELATTLVTGSPLYTVDNLQLYNMLTDGNPTVSDALVSVVDEIDGATTTMGLSMDAMDLLDFLVVDPDLEAAATSLGFDPNADAVSARNAAIGLMNPIDLISFEAIGFTAEELAFLREQLAAPAPGVEVTGPSFAFPDLPPDPNAQGFVISIAGFDEVSAALQAKFVATDAVVPEPVAGLMLAFAFGALGLARR